MDIEKINGILNKAIGSFHEEEVDDLSETKRSRGKSPVTYAETKAADVVKIAERIMELVSREDYENALDRVAQIKKSTVGLDKAIKAAKQDTAFGV